MERITKLFIMDIHRVCVTAIFVCLTTLVISQEKNSERLIKPDLERYRAYVHGWNVADSDTSKWHPKKFYVIYTDKRITFRFPYEKEQSGVRNLLFLNKETGKICLFDEERPLYE